MTVSDSRIYWRCRRGIREVEDLLLAFVDARYASLSEQERRTFARLLDYPDQILFEYTLGQVIPRDRTLARLLSKIRRPAGP